MKPIIGSNCSNAGRDAAPRRPSLLAQVWLSDGRLAWPVAQANGISEATFRWRLKAGLSPYDAATRPVPSRDRDAIQRKRNERVARHQAYLAQQAADRAARRVLGPARRRVDQSGDDYAGVIWSDDAARLIVSPRGASYAIQYRAPEGWQSEREFPTAGLLGVWVAVAADLPQAAHDAVASLPDDPSLSGLSPYRPSGS